MQTQTFQKNINALAILVLVGVLLGAFTVQFVEHEEPCPLCMLQRLAMIGVASSLLLNLQFGIRPSHYALALISSLVGGTVALRQISLHVCPGFPQFGLPVLGLSLYTWSFVIFACCVLGVALMLFLYEEHGNSEQGAKLNGLGKFAFIMILLLAVANIFSTFFQCGFGVCHD